MEIKAGKSYRANMPKDGATKHGVILGRRYTVTKIEGNIITLSSIRIEHESFISITKEQFNEVFNCGC
ncbi:hypothetical protein [Culicoidibacter larvae]|uniref:Uncharacterized protein n=1 Tax=Culicoidibacter larvae TaxID=2579976 RepID=A0A5R8Q9I1_9FIRM|nr:hypothetical protein [Culicoidibacter larvae]TLG72087.1 hypothetical protein FEZ08_09650 [Culicoidibacter larvae]